MFRKYTICVWLLAYPLGSIWIGAAISNSEAMRHFIFKNPWAEGCLAFTQFIVTCATICNYAVMCIYVIERKDK